MTTDHCKASNVLAFSFIHFQKIKKEKKEGIQERSGILEFMPARAGAGKCHRCIEQGGFSKTEFRLL